MAFRGESKHTDGSTPGNDSGANLDIFPASHKFDAIFADFYLSTRVLLGVWISLCPQEGDCDELRDNTLDNMGRSQ